MPQISKGRLEHLEERSKELTRVLGENERLQALDTEGLAHIQEENRVRSVAIEGQKKEIECLTAKNKEYAAMLKIERNLVDENERLTAENRALKEIIREDWIVSEDTWGDRLICRYCRRSVHRDWKKGTDECSHQKDCVMLDPDSTRQEQDENPDSFCDRCGEPCCGCYAEEAAAQSDQESRYAAMERKHEGKLLNDPD